MLASHKSFLLYKPFVPFLLLVFNLCPFKFQLIFQTLVWARYYSEAVIWKEKETGIFVLKICFGH